jgi:uracil-DNA glycosylase
MELTEKIKTKFGTWLPLFIPFIQSDKFDEIFRYLKMNVNAGRKVIPSSNDLFKSFELTDRNKLKVIIVLMDPYPSLSKDKIVIANGIPMDCSNTGVLQPSLELFYGGIENSYFGFEPDMDMRADISYLLKEEHVLMLNSSLSVELEKVGSHKALWTPFMKFFFEDVINKYFRGLPIVLCGDAAQKMERYINPMIHYIKKVEHPVAASYANRSWNYDDMFKWVNNLIRMNNGEAEQIRWYRKKGEQDTVYPDWVTGTEKINEDEIPGDLPWQKKQ